jgi:hypothetical protein
VLDGRADLYICGHEHDLQHLKPQGNLHFVIAGGGGARVRPIEKGERSLFAASSYGFAVLEAARNALAVRFIDDKLAPLYEFKVEK